MVLDTLVSDLPADWQVTDVYVGSHWVVSLVINGGVVRAGVAAALSHSTIQHCQPNEPADLAARRLLSDDQAQAAVALATLNAINPSADHLLTSADAPNWLAEQCKDRILAIFGRFPFIEAELRPVARQVWVFEREPQPGEYDASAIPDLVPQADFVAITGSSIINHTIDTILPHVRPGSVAILIGPSTPLSAKLFDFGINALFGVRVANVQQVIESVMAGGGFQKLQGLQRVALFKNDFIGNKVKI